MIPVITASVCVGLGLMVLASVAVASEPVLTQGVHGSVIQGLEIVVEKNSVTVRPGLCRIEGKEVAVKDSATFSIPPAGDLAVEKEERLLTNDKPNVWAVGTPLKCCLSAGTTLPGCLLPGSASLKLADGTLLEQEKDYLLDPVWGMMGRIEGGRIPADTPVYIDYRYNLMRIDTIAISQNGQITLLSGKPEKTCPHPPEVPSNSLALANVFLPYQSSVLDSKNIFVIGAAFPEPDAAEMKRRAQFVAKTLNKLRNGEKVCVVTWGDSVTVGGDASTPDKAFANQFIIRLRQRFPKAEIVHHNASIGGTNTGQRLPVLQEEVLSHKPDLVTIEYVNDMGFPADLLKQNYFSAFDQIHNASAEALLITPHFVMPSWMNKEFSRGPENRESVTLLREFAAEKGVGVADTSRRWEHLEIEGLPYITLLYNGINHPDDRGHELFVKDLLTFFPE